MTRIKQGSRGSTKQKSSVKKKGGTTLVEAKGILIVFKDYRKLRSQ